MKRILRDENGSYDLALVVAVNPVHQTASLAKPATVMAKIHMHGGQIFPVNLPHEEVLSKWVAVKEAEGHPSDKEEGPTGQTQ